MTDVRIPSRTYEGLYDNQPLMSAEHYDALGPRVPDRNRFYPGYLGALLNGATFNMGDELVSGVASGLSAATSDESLSDAYDRYLPWVRSQQKEWEENNPGDAFVLNVGGGAALPLGNVSGGLLRRAALASPIGAIIGGLYGFGGGEGEENRQEEGLVNAMIGGVLGPAFPLVGAGIRGGLGKLQEALRSRRLASRFQEGLGEMWSPPELPRLDYRVPQLGAE